MLTCDAFGVLPPISKLNFLNENETGEYEIFFGDGIFGKALSNGNIVKCEYIVSNRSLASDSASKTNTVSVSKKTFELQSLR